MQTTETPSTASSQNAESLRTGIAGGEIFVLYQPQLDLASGLLVGVESLARWQHPTDGVVSPTQFLPLAEKARLLDQLEARIAELVCGQIAAWKARGFDVPRVAVNISVHYQLIGTELPGLFARLIEQHGIAAGQLTAEVSESALMDDNGRNQTTLHALKDLGMRISIDDFGTGYSSLAYLSRYPVDELKIDRSFVADCQHHAANLRIVRTVEGMARNLGLSAVAMGIENEVQLAMLRGIGYAAGQGFHFAKPQSADEIFANYAF